MIKIAVVSYNNEQPVQPLSAVFGRDRNTLGRSKNNFFVLPDPKHYVSRLQASIWSDGIRHTLVNLSQANPILINGKEISPEQDFEIKIGDEINIGPYLLRAELSMPAANDGIGEQLSDFAKSMQKILPIHLHATTSVAHAMTTPTTTIDDTQNAEGEANASILMEAFLRGASIPGGTITSGLTPDLMELLGKVLAKSLQGTIELNALRTLVKREVKAELTMVVLRNNNPLKFFPDSQTVLMQMLRKKMPGFMNPLEAIEDAFDDLRAHQLGVVAGFRVAMHAMLKRLNPSTLEKQLAAPKFFDAMQPAKRKAEMWAMYVAQFETISVEAKDDFKTLFGKDFLVAYEREVERFKDSLRDD